MLHKAAHARIHRFAHKGAEWVGSPSALVCALSLVVVGVASGPFFRYSDTWSQLISTSTTLATGLIVFMIQAKANRDSRVIQLKLDELIRGTEGARNRLVSLEKLSDDELEILETQFTRLARRHLESPVRTAGSLGLSPPLPIPGEPAAVS